MHKDKEIRAAADSFREANWPEGRLPIDIELILEQQGIDVVPIHELRNKVGVDAALSADMKCVYVDWAYYLDERRLFRLRFSLAHELGHVVLHQRVFDAYRNAGLKSPLEWVRYVQDRFDNEMLEKEADEFAGALLVPEEALRSSYEEHYPRVQAAFATRK